MEAMEDPALEVEVMEDQASEVAAATARWEAATELLALEEAVVAMEEAATAH